MWNSKKGFTLIELIIVIVIIGILASIAAPMMQGIKAKAIATEAMTGLSALKTALDQYKVEYGAYPPQKNWWLSSYDKSCFPGLTIRSGGYGRKPSSLDGRYFSQDAYQYGGEPGEESVVLYVYIGFNASPGAQEAAATTDSPPNASMYNGQYPCMVYYLNTKTFKQHGWSKTGLPEAL